VFSTGTPVASVSGMNTMGDEGVEDAIARDVTCRVADPNEPSGQPTGPARGALPTVRTRSARVLTTVLFTDIVDSTAHAVALGDRRWVDLQRQLEQVLREEIRRFGGRALATTGDGLVAAFDGAATAVRCALRAQHASRALGLDLRCGLHCGEIERHGPHVGGIVFHAAARVMDLAAPGEVLVSGTLKELSAGSSLCFRPRGRRTIRGLPGHWLVFAALDDGPHGP
jgi:class 3 adenylate cyclase